jgi:hypothetical protein
MGKKNRFVVAALVFSVTQLAAGQVNVRDETTARFASVTEGAEILARKDDFIQRLSAFDRSARLKTDKPVSEEEFLKFLRANVLPWTSEDQERIETAIAHIRPALQALPLSLPKTVYFVKTTGAEEGRAFYTRGNAIMLPQGQLAAASLEKTIAHELFHILSRGDPALREKLYAIIGFTKCPEPAFPVDLKARKITNPDAPQNDHSIRVRVDERDCEAVSILFSNAEKYDVNRGGEFFNYLEFKFLLLRESRGPLSESSAQKSDAQLVAPEKVTGFFEKVGRNTDYVIHPEEILADNFALLIIGKQNVPSPDILKRMRDVLARP